MRLTSLALERVSAELAGAGIEGWLYVAPQDAALPLCTFFPVSISTEYTFGEVIERPTIQVSMYCDEADCSPLLSMAATIEALFENYEWDGPDGQRIICSHRSGGTGPEHLGTERHWRLTMDLEFICHRPKLEE